MLAALGWDRWKAGEGTDRLRRWFPAAVGALVVVLCGFFVVGFKGKSEAAIFTGLSLSAAFLLEFGRTHPGRAALAAGLLTLADLLGHGWSILHPVPATSRSAAPWYLAALGSAPSEFRVLDAANPRDYRPAVHGVRLMHGYGYPLISATRELYASAWDASLRVDFNSLGTGRTVVHPAALDLLNVGWLVWEGAPPESGLIETARDGGQVLYRRPSARGHVFTDAGHVPFVRRQNSIEATVTGAEDQSVIFSESDARLGAPRSTASGPRSGSGNRPHRRPGSAGHHTVRVFYRPVLFTLGLWISGLTLVAAAVLGGIRSFHPRRPGEGNLT